MPQTVHDLLRCSSNFVRLNILFPPIMGFFQEEKQSEKGNEEQNALQMPSKNRSDKWDRTMKVSVYPRKEKSRNPSNLGGFGMVRVLITDLKHNAKAAAHTFINDYDVWRKTIAFYRFSFFKASIGLSFLSLFRA